MQTIASEVMTMREEKPKAPSQKNKSFKKSNWFWPVMYASIAVLFVGMVWGYNAFNTKEAPALSEGDTPGVQQPVTVETNAQNETLKYPFSEDLRDNVAIIQEFYDAEDDEETRESALLVFNQSYLTNRGIAISIEGQPFEVVAAKSGTVEEIITDSFKGNEIVIAHADGMKTVYSSLTDVVVKEGDTVKQGDPLATAAQNEWNPQAGVHLHFEVLQEGVAVNPRSFLAF